MRATKQPERKTPTMTTDQTIRFHFATNDLTGASTAKRIAMLNSLIKEGVSSSGVRRTLQRLRNGVHYR